MVSLSKHTRLSKLVFLILLVHGIILLLLAVPFRFIIDSLYAGGEIYPNTEFLFITTLFPLIYLWYKPREHVTRVMIGITIFGDCLFSTVMFASDYSWVISDLRIILFLLYFFPVIPLAFYVATVQISQKSEITPEFKFNVYVVKILAHQDLAEGLDSVLASISSELSGELVPNTVRLFLEFLSKREDALGVLAREKLQMHI